MNTVHIINSALKYRPSLTFYTALNQHQLQDQLLPQNEWPNNYKYALLY